MKVGVRVTAAVFQDLLNRLIAGMKREIILIMDGHPAQCEIISNSHRSS